MQFSEPHRGKAKIGEPWLEVKAAAREKSFSHSKQREKRASD